MRPRVHVNCAATLDGYVGGPRRTPLRISNDADIRRVHALRAASDAILVGVGTVLADDPKLTVKWELVGQRGRAPLRVVLDPRLRTPSEALVRDANAPSLFFIGPDARPGGLDAERVPLREGRMELGVVLDRLGARGVRSVLVEGGPRTLHDFFAGGFVDAFTLFVAPRILGDADAPRLFEKPVDLSSTMRLQDAAVLGDGFLLAWQRA